MSNTNSISPFLPFLAEQLDSLFANGVVWSFVYHRSGVADVAFNGVVDQFPSRLSGVNPGDVRVRVRAEDLETILSPGPSDYITDSVGVSTDVISAAFEFGGLGIALQCRRRAATPLAQAQPVGLSIPSVTRSGRDALSNPAAGTALFQTDNTPGLRVFNGSNWVRFNEVIDL